MVYQGTFSMPLSMKLNENNRPTAWGIGFGGAYVSLNNQNFSEYMVSEIMNLQLGVYHLRPLNDKWSMRASVGMGVFTPSTDFSKIRDRKSTRLNSSHVKISYAVFCLKKKK